MKVTKDSRCRLWCVPYQNVLVSDPCPFGSPEMLSMANVIAMNKCVYVDSCMCKLFETLN